MKRWLKVLIPVVVLGGAAFGAVQATKGGGASKNGFTLVKVERGTIIDKALATGQIVPAQEIQVKSQISGIVKECFAEVGDRVEVGQPLFAIIPDPTPLELNEVEREVQLAEVTFAKAERRLRAQRGRSGTTASSRRSVSTPASRRSTRRGSSSSWRASGSPSPRRGRSRARRAASTR